LVYTEELVQLLETGVISHLRLDKIPVRRLHLHDLSSGNWWRNFVGANN
jgi:hypothetical protein